MSVKEREGLQIYNHTQNKSMVLPFGFESEAKASEIYVFCISRSLTDRLKCEFGAKACVEIFDLNRFIERWRGSLPGNAKTVSRRVAYYRPEEGPGPVWALPDLVITAKLNKFAYQDEYRLAYTTTNAFDFENCRYSLVSRNERPLPKPDEHNLSILDLGDLHDTCKLHVF
jgi:hypothetical protein